MILGGGAAIAPPPSLIESSASPPPSMFNSAKAAPSSGMGFAAKLMAKYGYKVKQSKLNKNLFYGKISFNFS